MTPLTQLGRWSAAICLGVVAGALLLPAAASAHGADAPRATSILVRVSGISPALPGVSVRVVEAGARLELTNNSGRALEILGYAGEPYLIVGPAGAAENLNSPATYTNATADGRTPVPPRADPAAAPEWRTVSGRPVARWHDHRANAMNEPLPATVRADRSRPHRIRNWTLQLRDGVDRFTVSGTTDWLPKPRTGLWWLGIAVVAAAIGGYGWRTTRTATRDPRPGYLLAGLLGVAAVAALVDTVGRAYDAGGGGWALLRPLFLEETWSVLAAVAALVAVGYAVTRGPAADFALALTGAGLALFGGLARALVLAYPVAPLPWAGGWARWAAATTLALAAGVTAAAAIRMRATLRQPAPAVSATPTSGTAR